MKRVVLFIFIIFLGTFFSYGNNLASVADVSIAEKYYMQGQGFLSKGDYISANKYFKKAEAMLEDDESQQDVSHAAKYVVKADFISQLNDDLERAKKAYLNGDYKSAVDIYQFCLSKDSKNYDILYNLSMALAGMEDYKSAAAMLEEILKTHPKDIIAQYNLGIIYESYLGEPLLALQHYKKYLLYCGNSDESTQVKEWVDYLDRQVR